MSSPIIISLYNKGRQQDYEATLTTHQSVLEFSVMINNNAVSFEGGINKDFAVKAKEETSAEKIDADLLESVRQQLNQIFW